MGYALGQSLSMFDLDGLNPRAVLLLGMKSKRLVPGLPSAQGGVIIQDLTFNTPVITDIAPKRFSNKAGTKKPYSNV